MSDPRHVLGSGAEAATARWLEAAGWHVVARRWRPGIVGAGEIDLVVLDPTGVLVAIEVRARRSTRTGGAAISVDRRRVLRLRRSLAAIGSSGTHPHRGLRVDLVACEPMADRQDRWRLVRTPGIG